MPKRIPVSADAANAATTGLGGTDAGIDVTLRISIARSALPQSNVAPMLVSFAASPGALWYPDEGWLPSTGLRALLACLAIGIPLTVFWCRHHKHGPLEARWPAAHAVRVLWLPTRVP